MSLCLLSRPAPLGGTAYALDGQPGKEILWQKKTCWHNERWGWKKAIAFKKKNVAQPARLALCERNPLIDTEGLGDEATATMAALVSPQVFRAGGTAEISRWWSASETTGTAAKGFPSPGRATDSAASVALPGWRPPGTCFRWLRGRSTTG